MESDVGTLHAVGNQPKVATKTGRLGIVQCGTDVPLCAGRLLCSGEQRIDALSPLLIRPREQWRAFVEHVEGVMGLSVAKFCFVPSWRRRVGRQLRCHVARVEEE